MDPNNTPIPRFAPIFFPGPAGQLEAKLFQPVTCVPNTSLVIICHPNPQAAGTMNNKVVTTTARTFARLGYITCCFNYRGVGKSEGSFDHQIGEVDDCCAIIKALSTQFPQSPLTLAGFSFGAYIARVAATRWPTTALLTIAPAVNHSDYTNLANLHCPWHLILAEADEIVPSQQILDFVTQEPQPIQVTVIKESSHFFHGKLNELQHWVQQTITSDA